MTESKGYMIVSAKIDATQRQELKHYISNARPIFQEYGGRPIGQYQVMESPVGESQSTHVIVMEFPSTDAVRRVFKDEKYTALVPARTAAFPVLEIMIAEDFNPMSLLGNS
jgi:uncharacterized protein (DUF1330 family)